MTDVNNLAVSLILSKEKLCTKKTDLNFMPLLSIDPNAKDPDYNLVQQVKENYNSTTLLSDRAEKLYEMVSDLVDKKFSTQIKADFGACYSEMLFAAVFRKRLAFTVTHPSDEGPDLFIKELDCWAEIATITDGEKGNPNSIPESIPGVVSTFPQNAAVLRMTHCFKKKAKQIKEWIDDENVSKNAKMVICINGGSLSGLHGIPMSIEGGPPQIVSALLAVKSNPNILIDKVTLKVVERSYEYQKTIPKTKVDSPKTDIETDYFLDPNYSFISAVIYSYANINAEIGEKTLGNDFLLVHNPNARNPIPAGSFKCGTEYFTVLNDDGITINAIKHEQRA